MTDFDQKTTQKCVQKGKPRRLYLFSILTPYFPEKGLLRGVFFGLLSPFTTLFVGF
jgi:hypothetical protein